jgi:hypothetical protein
VNLIGIADHRLRNRPSLDDFIDDDCDGLDEVDDCDEESTSREHDIFGGLTAPVAGEYHGWEAEVL